MQTEALRRGSLFVWRDCDRISGMSTAWQDIPCDATFTPDGRPHPQAITWQGALLPVVETGRRWAAADGLHFLVRVRDGRVFELSTHAGGWAARLLSVQAAGVT